MSSTARPTPVRSWIRVARRLGRVLAHVCRILLTALAMGVAPPSRVEKPVRHEDPVVQVEEERVP